MTTARPGQTRERLALLLILAAALFLRLPGTAWELPGRLHAFSYHPDELPVLGAASSVWPCGQGFNPRFYNYGTLQIYLLSVPAALSRSPDGINLAFATLLSRLLTALMGTATVAVCWYGGRRVAGVAGAVTAAAFVAIAPVHVQHSQFVTVDVPAAFWTSLALVAAISARTGAGGFFAGLAAATKYPAGAAVSAPLAAVWLMVSRAKRPKAAKAGAATAVAAAALAGFLIGCPGALIWTADFVRGLTYEMSHVSSGHGLVFRDTGPGPFHHLFRSLLPGLGWPLLALAAAAIILALGRRQKDARVLLIFAFVYFVLISLGVVRFARYVMPLIPALALLCAALMRQPRPRWAIPAVSAALAVTAAYGLLLNNAFLKPDPRTQAAEWIWEQASEHSISVAGPTVPWFYSPPLSPEFGALSVEDRRAAAAQARGVRMLVGASDWDVSILDQDPDAVVISDFESEDPERLKEADFERFMSRVRRDYKPARQFGGQPGVEFFTLGWKLPHDMRYPSPEIAVYVRKAQP